jgi:hypothetical protein
MSDTNGLVRKSNGATPLVKLARMLQSMSRRFPRTCLIGTRDDFGVLLDDDRSLRIVCNGRWTDEDIRDWLALFATWLVADAATIRSGGIPLDGVSRRVRQASEQ